MNCNCDWKLAVSRVVDFKRRFTDRDQRIWETLMDLKFDFLNQERQILLFCKIIGQVCFFETSYICAPFMRQLPIMNPRNINGSFQCLSYRANDHRNSYLNSWYSPDYCVFSYIRFLVFHLYILFTILLFINVFNLCIFRLRTGSRHVQLLVILHFYKV